MTDGEKTVPDHRGDMVKVKGSIYNGCLTGYGEYTDKGGNKWYAYFYNDMKHGICRVDQTVGIRQTGCLFNGQYHGPLTFWHSTGQCENVMFENRKEIKRRGRDNAGVAYFTRDGGIVNAKASNWRDYC